MRDSSLFWTMGQEEYYHQRFVSAKKWMPKHVAMICSDSPATKEAALNEINRILNRPVSAKRIVETGEYFIKTLRERIINQ